MTLRQRKPRKRSEKWLDAVRGIECCVLCGRYGTEAAHRDFGKGFSMKTDDCLTAALCKSCHHEIGNGKELSRDERRALMDKAIVETFHQLVTSGIVGLT